MILKLIIQTINPIHNKLLVNQAYWGIHFILKKQSNYLEITNKNHLPILRYPTQIYKCSCVQTNMKNRTFLTNFNKCMYSNSNKPYQQKQSQKNKPQSQSQPKSKQQKQKQTNSQQQRSKKQAKQQIRLQKIKELQQQQIRAIHDKVNLTKGHYSPFIQYLKLNKFVLGTLSLMILPGLLAYKLFSMIGIWTVQQFQSSQISNKDRKYSIKKKISLISSQFQSKYIYPYVSKLFLNYYQQIPKQNISEPLQNKLSLVSKKLSKIFPAKPQNYTFKLLASEQPVVLCLPNNNILISKSLLRTPILQQNQLQFLVLLSVQLFKQGYHLRTIALTQINTFWQMDSATSQIKLRQIYTRKYKRNQILHNIDITLSKLKAVNEDLTDRTVKNLFQNLKKINQQYEQGSKKPSQQNIYQRLFKYYIFVKVQ